MRKAAERQKGRPFSRPFRTLILPLCLPAKLKSKLELPRVIGCSRLTRRASCTGRRVAELVHSSDIKTVEQVKGVSDEVQAEPLTQRYGPRDAQIRLEETRRGEAIAAEIPITACGRRDAWNCKRRPIVRQARGSQAERDTRNEGRT